MTKRVNIDMANLRRVLSAGLATTALAIVLIYVLGAQAILQTPQAEAGHILLMSLIQGIEGHALQSQMHGGPESGSQMQEMKQGAMFGIIGNNVLGTPKTISAGGLAVVVVTSAIVLSAAAFVVSGRRLSFLVPGLLTTSGIILMILPLHPYDTPSVSFSECKLCSHRVSGPYRGSNHWASDLRAWRRRRIENN